MQTRGAGLLPCLRCGSVVPALVGRDPRKARSPALLTAACAREMRTPERADDRALVRVENWLGKNQLPVWGVAFVSPPGFLALCSALPKLCQNMDLIVTFVLIIGRACEIREELQHEM